MNLIDLNQITFSNLFAHVRNFEEVDADLLRYMILNSIRSYNVKLFDRNKEIVITCDSKNNWRREVFPYYKAARKKSREESKLDWNKIFTAFDTVKSELKEFFPYTVIDVDRAESDDIIGVLVKQSTDDILILSGDTDFVQLHRPGVKQYNPVRKKYVTIKDPEYYLQEHILEGDTGDGIPNVLSADDTFVLGKRQKPLTLKRKEALIKDHSSVKRNYLRNKELIDLNCVPESIKLNINEAYNNKKPADRSKLFNYFYDRKLTKFIHTIKEF